MSAASEAGPGSPTIHELADAADRFAAAHDMIFEVAGAWARTSGSGSQRRRWATAAHRSSWHASLWADRSPAIPGLERPNDVATRAEALRTELDHDAATERDTALDAALVEIRRSVSALIARTDALVDPSTARVLDLVAHDLDQLLADRPTTEPADPLESSAGSTPADASPATAALLGPHAVPTPR